MCSILRMHIAWVRKSLSTVYVVNVEGSWENASTGPSPVPSAHVDMLTYDNISCLPEPSTLESTEQVTRILIEFLVTRY